MTTAARVWGTCLLMATIAGVPAYAQQPAPPKAGFTLRSPAFPDGGEIPPRFTVADPKPVSPKLEWTNVPAGTISFALIFHDLEFANNKTPDDALHWLVFNMPGTLRELPEAVPDGPMADGTVQAKNFRNNPGYLRPGAQAPPHHHYTFELYALDTKLDLSADATRADVLKAMSGHILGKAVLMGRFHR